MDEFINFVQTFWKITSIISAREIERHVINIAGFGPRPEGTMANIRAGQYIENEFRRAALAVHRLPLDFTVLENTQTSLTVIKPYYKDYLCEGHLRTGLTSDDGIRAPLIYLGKAFPEDFHHHNIEGKIVLAYEDIPFEGKGATGIRYFGERVQDCYQAGGVGIIFADYRPDDLITSWGIMRDLAPIPCLAVSFPSLVELRHFAETGTVEVQIKVRANIQHRQSDVISAGEEGEGTKPVVVLLGTHYETVPTCPGANDNASSLAILLELARVLNAQDLPIDILYIASTGEEAGSFGMIEYVNKHRNWLASRAIAAIAFDQVGGADVPLSAHGTPELNRLLIDTAKAMGFKLRQDDDPERPLRTGLSDVQPFFDLGIPSAYLGGWASDLYYHTCADTPDKINPNALKVLADIIAVTILRLVANIKQLS